MLKSQEGIHSVTVALLAERGVVHYDPHAWTVDKIIGVSVPHTTPLLDTLSFSVLYGGPWFPVSPFIHHSADKRPGVYFITRV